MKNKIFSLSLSIIVAAISVLSYSSTMTQTMAAEWEEIQKRGKLIVGVKDNLRPLGFRDSEGNLQGLEIDIAKRIAAELLGDSSAIELVPVTNQERLRVVIEDRVDIAIARVTSTPSRARVVEFSPYYYLDGTSIVTKSANLKSLANLEGKKIAVLNGSTTTFTIQYEVSNVEIIRVNSYQEALEVLESGMADAFAADGSILTGWVQEYPQYRLLPETLSIEALCIVMPRGLQYLELRDRVRELIKSWQSSGWLQERASYWGLP